MFPSYRDVKVFGLSLRISGYFFNLFITLAPNSHFSNSAHFLSGCTTDYCLFPPAAKKSLLKLVLFWRGVKCVSAPPWWFSFRRKIPSDGLESHFPPVVHSVVMPPAGGQRELHRDGRNKSRNGFKDQQTVQRWVTDSSSLSAGFVISGSFSQCRRAVAAAAERPLQVSINSFASILQSTSIHVLFLSASSLALVFRRIRGEAKKCRKVYGIEHRDQWCTACRWKKACQRFHD